MRARSAHCPALAPSCSHRTAIEPLEARQLFAADLTGSITTAPDAFLPGGRNKVVVRLTNIGDTAVSRATVGINLFASTDMTLDPGDLPVFNASKRLTVRGGGGGAN